MSSGEGKRVSRQDIQLMTEVLESDLLVRRYSLRSAMVIQVQNLIEQCIQLYMNEKEIVETLSVRAKIEPGFTQLVWQKLEEENREFFKAYHVRLMVKQQIMIFNELLEKQVEFMRKMCPVGVGSLPISNGSNSSSLHQNPCYVDEQRVSPSSLNNMHHPVGPSSTLINGGPPMHGSMHSADGVLVHNGRIDVSPDMISSQNAHMGMIQGMNGNHGIVIKSESGYSNSSAFTYGLDGNVLETRPTIGDASVASFSSVDSNTHPLNTSLLDNDGSFGFLANIPRSFSLTDLTALSHSAELESYSRSPFLATDTDDFLDSPGRDCQGENKRLDTISEGLSYEEFGSD